MYEGIYQTEEEKKASLYSIGSRIRYFRKMAKLTQAELASLVDIDYRTLSRYENGVAEMGVNLVFKIAAALHISVNDLAPEWMGREKEDVFQEKAESIYPGAGAIHRGKLLSLRIVWRHVNGSARTVYKEIQRAVLDSGGILQDNG